MKKTAAVSVLAAEVALLTSVRLAVAAETAEGTRQQLEEVVVVARRKEQSVLDVPVSVSVFDAALIEQKNIQSAKDFLVQTPNVTFSQGGRGGAREIIIGIRGITDIKGGEKIAIQSAFATYFDEFSVGTQATGQANPPLYDVQSIEVLRGPQGIFFGRNAEGGAINITTKKPSPGPYGQFDFGVGSFDSYELSAVANVPVSETLFTRATVQTTTTDGPIKNRHPTGGDTGADFLAVRGQVRWLPTEATTVDLSVNYIIDQQDYTPKLATCVTPRFGWPQFEPGVNGGIGCYDPEGEFKKRVAQGRIVVPPGVFVGTNDDSHYQNTREFTDNEATMVIGRVQHEFAGLALTSVTGAISTTSDQYLDLDHSGVDSIDRSGLFETDSWSQELRLSTTGERKLDWTVGALYFDESSSNENHILIKDLFNVWMRGDHANENIIEVNRDGWAAFASVEWHMTDQWSLTAGARYSVDNDEQRWRNVYGACDSRELGTPLADGCELRPEHVVAPVIQQLPDGTLVTNGGRRAQTAGTYGKNDSTDVSPTVAINWRPSADTSMYATVGKGYKGAGARLNPDFGFEHTSLYDKEQLWNYEIGFNTWLMDRRLALRGAIFCMDWKDMQVELTETFCRLDRPGEAPLLIPIDEWPGPGPCLLTPFNSTVNAEKAFSRGVELSADALVGERWTFSAAVGYNQAEFKEFVPFVRGTTRDVSGEVLANAPEWTASASAEYRQQLFGGDLFVRLDGSYRSEAEFTVTQRLATNVWPLKQASFALANMQIGVDRGTQRVALVVNNLLDNEYYTAVDTFSYAGTMLDYNPRTWFVKWTWRTE